MTHSGIISVAIRFRKLTASLQHMVMVCLAALAGSAQADALGIDLFQAAGLVSERHLSAPDRADIPTSSNSDFEQYLASLDPYSQLLTPAEYKAYQNSRVGGRRNGIGAAVFLVDDSLLLVPLQGGALYDSGLRDVVELLAVDDQPLPIKSINVLQARLSDTETTVQLTLREIATEKIRHIQLNKSRIKLGVAELHTQAAIPFIRLHDIVPHITANSVLQVYKELLSLDGSVPAVILDLRYSPGGDLTEAAKIMDLFVPAGQLLFTTYDKQGERLSLHSTSDTIPTVSLQDLYILVGPLTASAAEVMAKTLTHYGAKTLGWPTFGKCMVQEIFELSHGYAFSLTTQQVIAVNEEACTGKGVEPDELLPDDYLSNVTQTVIDYVDSEILKNNRIHGATEREKRDSTNATNVDISEGQQRIRRFEQYAAEAAVKQKQPEEIEKRKTIDMNNAICAEITLTNDQSLPEYKRDFNELYGRFGDEVQLMETPLLLCLGPFPSKNKAQSQADLINEIWHDQFKFYDQVSDVINHSY